jgi:hypothetical protein
MEEVIGYVIVGSVIVGLYLGIKKLFKKKTSLFEYEDEIILDKKMLHYGPFSGAFVYPHRKFILLLSISSSFLTADWDIRTIDGWGIDSYSSENLIMQKTSDNTKSNLYLEMARPFCITSEPTITTPVGNTNYSENDDIKATMTVDRGKPKEILLQIGNIIGEGPDIDYVFKLAYFPSFRNGKTFHIKFNNDTRLEDMSFTIEGLSNAMKQSEKMCMSSYDFYEEEMQETSFI